ncbi:DUF2007 domain-containing protein [Candidatus Kuenenbacteria bacterium]|nr:DUF2007 domain-containing protein [Candidatus Kuenenbacteria bacterium]
MSDLVKITAYNTRAEAELMADLLKNNGIKSLISSDGSGIAHNEFYRGLSQLWVNKEDEQKAREILEV